MQNSDSKLIDDNLDEENFRWHGEDSFHSTDHQFFYEDFAKGSQGEEARDQRMGAFKEQLALDREDELQKKASEKQLQVERSVEAFGRELGIESDDSDELDQ